VQRLLANRVSGALVTRLIGRRTFARSFASVYSVEHPLSEPELEQHWRVLERRGGTAPLSHRLARYMADRKRYGARWEAALETGQLPIGFVWGMADPRSGRRMADEIRRRVPAAPFVALERVGHYPHLEVPDTVAREIAR